MSKKQISDTAVKAMGGEESYFLPTNAKGSDFLAISGTKQRPRRLIYGRVLGLLLLGAFFFKLSTSIVNFKHNAPSSLATKTDIGPDYPRKEQCPQVEPLSPKYTTPALDEMDNWLSSKKYSKISANLLSKAITYQTVSYESMSDPDLPLDDPLYDPFKTFYEEFIRVEFPNLTTALNLQTVNKHGLLYTWTGSDPELKPILLMAHQDVVPVEEESLDEWKKEPWGGEVDNGFIWGRGSFDTKHTLVAILEAVEELLVADFEPKRSVLLSFGFDEELGGLKGGKELARTISEQYNDGADVLIDEGSVGFTMWESDMVMIGVAEKDRMPLNIEIRTPGGRASQPVEHTAIGVMSQIVVDLEDLEAYRDPPSVLKPLLKDRLAGNFPPIEHDRLATEFVKNAGPLQDAVQWSLTTAKSVNIIQGGSKGNSLPEFVNATADIRIHIAETLQSTKNDISRVLSAVARQHDLAFVDFDDTYEETPEQSIRVWGGGIGETPRISPSKVKRGQDTPWSILAGTTRNVLDSHIVVAPGMSPGSTGAKWYPDVTDYIYRYSPGASLKDTANMHTVNEAISVKDHVAAVKWYSNVIRNLDEADFD